MAENTDKNKKNNELDEDILQSKRDVLRAKDIIPSDTGSEPDNNQGPETKSKEQKQTEAPDTDKKTQIPEFDLAEQIMAQQRKTTAGRRKAPSQKEKADKAPKKTEPKPHIITQKSKGPEGKLIAEIVAKDIQKLCQKN